MSVKDIRNHFVSTTSPGQVDTGVSGYWSNGGRGGADHTCAHKLLTCIAVYRYQWCTVVYVHIIQEKSAWHLPIHESLRILRQKAWFVHVLYNACVHV